MGRTKVLSDSDLPTPAYYTDRAMEHWSYGDVYVREVFPPYFIPFGVRVLFQVQHRRHPEYLVERYYFNDYSLMDVPWELLQRAGIK